MDDNTRARVDSGATQPAAPATEPVYTKTNAELYRNGARHEVWRITAVDGSLIAEDIASDHDMTWLRDYHEHLHLGDTAATNIADRRRHGLER